MNQEQKIILDSIAASLKEAGFNPFEQLTGYVESGNPLYITRLNDSRTKIESIDIAAIKIYLAECKNK